MFDDKAATTDRAIEQSDNSTAEALFSGLQQTHGGLIGASARVQDTLRLAGDERRSSTPRPTAEGPRPRAKANGRHQGTSRLRSLARRCMLSPNGTQYVLGLIGNVESDQAGVRAQRPSPERPGRRQRRMASGERWWLPRSTKRDHRLRRPRLCDQHARKALERRVLDRRADARSIATWVARTFPMTADAGRAAVANRASRRPRAGRSWNVARNGGLTRRGHSGALIEQQTQRKGAFDPDDKGTPDMRVCDRGRPSWQSRRCHRRQQVPGKSTPTSPRCRRRADRRHTTTDDSVVVPMISRLDVPRRHTTEDLVVTLMPARFWSSASGRGSGNLGRRDGSPSGSPWVVADCHVGRWGRGDPHSGGAGMPRWISASVCAVRQAVRATPRRTHRVPFGASNVPRTVHGFVCPAATWMTVSP